MHNKIKYPRLKVIKNWSKEILKGLKYLHEQEIPIIHRDIKCDNIFINSHEGTIKIGDLGFSCQLTNQFARSFSGTVEFMAPEVLRSMYGVKADIYSFGMCLLEMITLEKPYKECEYMCEVFEKIKANRLPLSLDTIMNSTVSNFIKLCLRGCESERPTASELLNDEFFWDIDSEENNCPVKLNTKDFEETIKKRNPNSSLNIVFINVDSKNKPNTLKEVKNTPLLNSNSQVGFYDNDNILDYKNQNLPKKTVSQKNGDINEKKKLNSLLSKKIQNFPENNKLPRNNSGSLFLNTDDHYNQESSESEDIYYCAMETNEERKDKESYVAKDKDNKVNYLNDKELIKDNNLNDKEKEKEKDKEKVEIVGIPKKEKIEKKGPNFILSIDDENNSFEDNQILVSLIKNNISKNKSLIRFTYNLLTDTSDGIVKELMHEINLTSEEISELSKDLNYLVDKYNEVQLTQKNEKSSYNNANGFKEELANSIPSEKSIGSKAQSNPSMTNSKIENGGSAFYSSPNVNNNSTCNSNSNYNTYNSSNNFNPYSNIVNNNLVSVSNNYLRKSENSTANKLKNNNIVPKEETKNPFVNNNNQNNNKNVNNSIYKSNVNENTYTNSNKSILNHYLTNDKYDNIFKQFENFVAKGYTILEHKKDYENQKNTEVKDKVLKKFEMLKMFLDNFNN